MTPEDKAELDQTFEQICKLDPLLRVFWDWHTIGEFTETETLKMMVNAMFARCKYVEEDLARHAGKTPLYMNILETLARMSPRDIAERAKSQPEDTETGGGQ